MKTFLATLIGLVASFAIMMLIETAGHALFPLPFDVNTSNISEIGDKLHLIPTGAYLSVVLAHGIGMLLGLLIARSIDRLTAFPVYLIAGFLFLGTVANLFMIPHPVWFGVADVSVTALVGLLFILRMKKQVSQ